MQKKIDLLLPMQSMLKFDDNYSKTSGNFR